MSYRYFLAKAVLDRRVHVGPALFMHQGATDGVRHRDVLDALAFVFEKMQLSLQMFTAIRIVEIIEEPVHQ